MVMVTVLSLEELIAVGFNTIFFNESKLQLYAICDIILFFVCQVGGYLAEVKTTSQMELLLGLAGMQAITQPHPTSPI